MQASVLRTLEFDRIRDLLAHDALTSLGRERALALEPGVDVADIQARLNLTTEAAAMVAAGGSLAIWAPDELPNSLATLDVGEQPLDPLALMGMARFVGSVEDVAEAATRYAARPMAGPAPSSSGLREIASRVASFAQEAAAIRRAIQPSGDINDDASQALKDIREKLRRQRARLRSTLEGLTRGRDTAKYLQDQIITDRNGRYVVVVRSEHREAIPGIVHGSSASGASLYLEPLSTVSLNNDVVELAEREKEEIHRILLALTDAFRRREDELASTVQAAADFDELYAKATLAVRLDGVAPILIMDGRVEFRGARHPLLVLRAHTEGRESFSDVVAGDLLLLPPTRALVISGPNTGGKTVALKAIGLLALMAQAGLLIPVEKGSSFTSFRSVFADIGDDQSISASLSTFSAHIANLVEMERALEMPALVLLDELGGGTDPIEGGALGTAVIDHFRQRGALVVATTHDDGLKSYAATTEGVATAALGFEPDTYAPTYRLVYGAPGRSLAFEIADRLGMPASVIAAARARRSGRESQLAAHLARVDQELAAVSRERELATRERESLMLERKKLLEHETRLAEREAVLKKRLDDRIGEKLREAREEVDRIVGRLKQKADSLADRTAKPLTTGEVGNLRVEGRAALEAVAAAHGAPEDAAPSDRLDGPPVVGQTVFVPSFAAEGIVRGVNGERVDLEIRGKRMRVSASDLRRPASKAAARHSGTVTVGTAPRPAGASRELVLIGTTVDEAIARAEKFLDDALLADERRLRVVHGHGTGKLRDALRTFFRAHPLVASAVAAPDNEGGQAATIVELKD